MAGVTPARGNSVWVCVGVGVGVCVGVCVWTGGRVAAQLGGRQHSILSGLGTGNGAWGGEQGAHAAPRLRRSRCLPARTTSWPGSTQRGPGMCVVYRTDICGGTPLRTPAGGATWALVVALQRLGVPVHLCSGTYPLPNAVQGAMGRCQWGEGSLTYAWRHDHCIASYPPPLLRKHGRGPKSPGKAVQRLRTTHTTAKPGA